MNDAIKKGGMGKLSFGSGSDFGAAFSRKRSRSKIEPDRPLKKGEMPLIITAYFKGPAATRPSAKARLLGLTARDLGEDREAWVKFYEENRGSDIRGWRVSGMKEAGVDVEGLDGLALVRALIEALRHEKRPIREAAFMWLRETAGQQLPFVPDGTRELIEIYYKQWLVWVEKEEKHAAAASKPKIETKETPAADTPENPCTPETS
jgi:hypothetical protein